MHIRKEIIANEARLLKVPFPWSPILVTISRDLKWTSLPSDDDQSQSVKPQTQGLLNQLECCTYLYLFFVVISIFYWVSIFSIFFILVFHCTQEHKSLKSNSLNAHSCNKTDSVSVIDLTNWHIYRSCLKVTYPPFRKTCFPDRKWTPPSIMFITFYLSHKNFKA